MISIVLQQLTVLAAHQRPVQQFSHNKRVAHYSTCIWLISHPTPVTPHPPPTHPIRTGCIHNLIQIATNEAMMMIVARRSCAPHISFARVDTLSARRHSRRWAQVLRFTSV